MATLPEQQARQIIDAMLAAAGWAVQDYKAFDPSASIGIAFQPRYQVFLLEFLSKTGRLDKWFTGSTIKHFTLESFIASPIPLPPLAEQTRIVAEVERRLSVVEELEAVVTTNLQRATRLRQAVIQKAFTGEL